MILSIIVFLLVLGVLVFVHELGHFMVAKWTGMRVDEFALGFPPRIWSIKRGDTRYAINALPLGGYVKIHGESAKGEEPDPRAFPNRPIWARILVIIAGVSMNVLFAFLVLTIAYSIGFPSLGPDIDSLPGAVVQKSDVLVSEVLPGSPAETAKVKAGEIIRSFTDKQTGQVTVIDSVSKLQSFTKERQTADKRTLDVTVDDNGTLTTVPVTIAASGPAMGVAVEDLNQIRLPVWQAPRAAYSVMSYVTSTTWEALRQFGVQLFGHAQLDKQVSGPVGIYKATSAATHEGFPSVVFLTVALSLNLALLNIMPIPALDGGKLVFLVIELIFRKRVVSEQIENAVTSIGFILLIGLITVLTLRDVGLF
ncbi:MAG: site-2 protease family protein [bacterium]